MKPVIGVMPLWDDEKESLWMLPGYLDGLREAGGLPVIFPFSTDEEELGQLMSLCDGFLFTGGHDVSPGRYHEEPLPGLVSFSEKRDEMESIVLRKALEADKPVLGICRGIQFINAALGGSLYQDLPSQRPSGTEHHQHAPYDVPAHEVLVEKDSPLYACLGAEQIPVNSYHHQAVKQVADGLQVMAEAPDGLAEALYRPGSRFLWALQWHPEFSYRTDENSRKIFRAFVSSME
jgi:putative glutamine amidotransferase